jgi:4'-phosphopantetheinyl transferase EntD
LCAAELAKWKDTSNLLTLAWSAKESIYKAVGKPGLSFQKEIEISDFEQNPSKARIATEEEISIFWEEFTEFSLTVALI